MKLSKHFPGEESAARRGEEPFRHREQLVQGLVGKRGSVAYGEQCQGSGEMGGTEPPAGNLGEISKRQVMKGLGVLL